jgi:excinuclease ABC subunit A
VVDLGPEAGQGGGDLVAAGTPEAIVAEPRSLTGRFLAPVLAAGPLVERPRFDPTAAARARRSAENPEQERSRVPGRNGHEAAPRASVANRSPAAEPRAPWELDGRTWHTRDRIARNGRPARWDGRILETIVDRIEALGASANGDGAAFAPTDWSQRGVVRINASTPAKLGFPFFHATTSMEWVVTFRLVVPKGTFRPTVLEKQLALVPFHQSEPPVLCDQPRLRVSDLGPFQEITLVGHTAVDFETPGFDEFLRKAARAFLGIGKPAKLKKASELDG